MSHFISGRKYVHFFIGRKCVRRKNVPVPTCPWFCRYCLTYFYWDPPWQRLRLKKGQDEEEKLIVQSIYRTGRVRILSVGRNAPAGATTMGAEIFVLPGASAATKGSFPRRTFLIIFMVKYLVYYFLDHFRSWWSRMLNNCWTSWACNIWP